MGEKNEILYVGKAKNLKKRVRSYLRYKNLNTRIKKLVTQAQKLTFEVLSNELEAILIEAELIRLHQPKFNILLKDDKTPIYLHITTDTFPTLRKIRKKEIYKIKKNQGTILGPFPSSYKLNEVLKIVRKIFPWCNKRGSNKQKLKKPCFYYHIEQCPGACIGEIDQQTYKQNIQELILFLRGKKQKISKLLKKKLQQYSDNQEYELAAKVKKQLDLIQEVTSKQYKLKPTLVLPQLNQATTKHALNHLLKLIRTYIQLPKTFQFNRIEGYDVSNISGTNSAVSQVVFINGKPSKKNYRLYNIRNLNTPNDYQMMKQALIRRQKHQEWQLPNLIVIDGGKGQLRAALKVWNFNNPIISLVKNPDRILIPIIERRKPRLKVTYQIIKLASTHPTLQLLQSIRDESHRFAKKQHKKLRLKNFISDN